jgi:hypothetical protein
MRIFSQKIIGIKMKFSQLKNYLTKLNYLNLVLFKKSIRRVIQLVD